MFQWLKNLFKKRGSGLDYYHPEERRIYSYFDGEKVRKVDPLPLYSKYLAKEPVIYANLKTLSFKGVDERFFKEAEASLVGIVRETFSLRQLVNGEEIPEGGTLTNSECLVLLDHFVLYMDDLLKKNLTPETSPSSRSHTDASQPTRNIARSSSPREGSSTGSRERSSLASR